MCGPDTQKGKAIAGESGFNGLRGHIREIGLLGDSLRDCIRESGLLGDGLRGHIREIGWLWDGLWTGSGLLWGSSGLRLADWSLVRRT